MNKLLRKAKRDVRSLSLNEWESLKRNGLIKKPTIILNIEELGFFSALIFVKTDLERIDLILQILRKQGNINNAYLCVDETIVIESIHKSLKSLELLRLLLSLYSKDIEIFLVSKCLRREEFLS